MGELLWVAATQGTATLLASPLGGKPASSPREEDAAYAGGVGASAQARPREEVKSGLAP